MEELLPENMKVIAIQNYGPSGTLFLHSLLDDHPQVIQLPGLSGIHLLKNIDKKLAERPLTASELGGIFYSVYSCLYNPEQLSYDHGLSYLGEDCNEHPCIDESVFSEYFVTYVQFLMRRYNLPIQIEPGHENKYLRIFFHAVYAAYAKGLGQDPSQKTILVYPIHSGHPDQALRLQDMFEECVFIHMIRNPLDMIDSTMKYLQYSQKYHHNHLNIFHCAISQVFQDHAPQVEFFYRMHSIYPYPRSDGTTKIVEFSVQFEKLHTQPEATLREICEQSDFEWHDNLLKSTFAGKQWWNRPGLRQVSGFNREMKPKKKLKYYPAFDKWRISALARPLLEGLGYRKKIHPIFSFVERITAQILCVFPFYVERIALDGVRGIILAHEKNASIGNKYSRDISTVAKAYWDARRRTSLFRLPIIDEEEENKPGNQRVVFLFRDSEDNVCSSPINDFDTSVHLVKTGVLQDYDDPSIPKLTWVEKVKCSVRVYMREYVENRKKMWEAHQEVRQRQGEMLYPLAGLEQTSAQEPVQRECTSLSETH